MYNKFGMIFLTFFLIASSAVNTIHKDALITITRASNPFKYNLDITVIPASKPDAPVTVCCHGYGSSNKIADAIHSFGAVSDHLIGFNFPDNAATMESYKPENSSFGSIHEILPLLYVLKLCVIDGHPTSINLYGFSAGGGAVINALATLNHTTYDQQLKSIGIEPEQKKTILDAVQKGLIILDCPLKSIDEISELRGADPEFTMLAARYKSNNMRPIDALSLLKGLKLNVLLNFQVPDEIIGNREDKLFIRRLRAANAGKTHVVTGNDGGHNAYHAKLWRKYKKLVPASY